MQQITLGNKQIIPLGVWKDMPLYLEKDDTSITLYHGYIPVDVSDCPKRSDLGFSELKSVTIDSVLPVSGAEYSVLTGLSYSQVGDLVDTLLYGNKSASDLHKITEFDGAHVTEDERVVLINIANRIVAETWQKVIDILSKFDKEKAIHGAEQILITKEIEKAILKTPYGSTDGVDGNDKKVIARYFNPYGAGTWYVLENSDYKSEEKIVFGAVTLGYGLELGNFSLKELRDLRVKLGSVSLPIERDSSVQPFKYTLGELMKQYNEEWM